MAVRKNLGVVLVLTTLMAPAGAVPAKPSRDSAELIVANFDSGSKPNNVGGDFGSWTKDPNDPMQGVIESFDAADRFGHRGYALRVIYSVASDKPAFGGIWMRLQNLNASGFDNLAFRVRGAAKMGYTTVFKVELKDAAEQSSHYYVRGVTDQWQDMVIPLRDLEGMAQFSRLKEFVIVLEDTTATTKRGVLYLDDVRFTKNPS